MPRNYAPLIAFALALSTTTVTTHAGAEVVLIPIGGTRAPIEGAFGSKWVATEYVRNTGSSVVEYVAPNCPTGLCVFPLLRGETSGSLGDPFGMFLINGSADQVRFFTVVRDANRQNETWGAEIRAVRERELQPDRIELIRVPTDLAFRRNLRLYTVRTTTEVNDLSTVRVRVYDAAEDLASRQRLIGEREFTLELA